MARGIHDECLARRAPDDERGKIFEWDAGVSPSSMLVIAEGPTIVGYLQYETHDADHLHVVEVVVDPDRWARGYGSMLLTELAAMRGEICSGPASVSAIVPLGHTAMLRAVCRVGFLGRSVFRDYQRAGRDSIYCQLKLHAVHVDTDDRFVVPAGEINQIRELLAQDSYVLTNAYRRVQGDLVAISKVNEDDVSALAAAESGSSVQFSGALLAGLTFLLAVAFGSTPIRFPVSALVLLVLGTALTLMSLVIYTNGSGELARIRSGEFDAYMKWGNLLSEYGGIIPFFLVLPVSFAQATGNDVASWMVGALVSLIAAGYEFSPYSSTRRYPTNAFITVLAWVTVTLPFLGAFTIHSSWASWTWSAVATSAIFARIGFNAPTHIHEVNPQHRNRGRKIR